MFDTTLGGAPTGDPAVFFDERYILESNNSRHADKRPKFVADPAGSGRKVMLVYLESTDAPLLPPVAQRSEISARRAYTPPGMERWYALSFYLDQHWPIYDTKTKFVLAQIHTSQKTTIVSPPVEIHVVGDRMTLVTRYNERPVPPVLGAIPPDPDYYATKSNSAQQFVRLGKLQKQQWYSFVINAGWSRDAHQGHLKVWMNGAMVLEQWQHPNAYENLESGLGMWPKIGIYAPGGFDKERWTKPALVKSYVDWIYLADPGGIGPGEMFSKTPLGAVVPEPTFAK